MENLDENTDGEDNRRLIVAITDFLRDQLIARTDFVPEDEDCLEIAIECLEMAYGLDADHYLRYRFERPLLDVFNQVTNPVSIRDKLRAEEHKEEGNACMLRNEFMNAETEYNQAIELDRWNAIYYCNRASARIEQHHYFEAISDCREALMLNPDYAKAHARMGQAYALLHRPRDAARCFRQALELEPGNERYEHNLRTAESQVSRPEALLANLLSSLFGSPPNLSNNAGSTSRITLPTSFMIITESHPPTREDPPVNAQNIQTETTENRARNMLESPTDAYNIVYPPSFGVIDEGQEEESGHLEVPSGNENVSENREAILIEIHSFDFFPDTSTSNSQIETEDSRTEIEGRENCREDRTENSEDRTNDSTYTENTSGESDSKITIGKEPDETAVATHNFKDETRKLEVTSVVGSSFPDSGRTAATAENAKQETDSKIEPEKSGEDLAVSKNEGSIQKASKENQITDYETTSRNEEGNASRIVEKSENRNFPMNYDELQNLKEKYNADIKTESTNGKDNSFQEETKYTGHDVIGGFGVTDNSIKTDGCKERTEGKIDSKSKYARELTNSIENEDSVSGNGVLHQKTCEEMQSSKSTATGRDIIIRNKTIEQEVEPAKEESDSITENKQGNAKDQNVNNTSKEKSENKNPDDTEST